MLNEANLLLNQEVVVTSHMSRFTGRHGIVLGIMADGRTLEVALGGDKVAFVDITLVSEIQEPTWFAKGEPDLGPDANSVPPHNRL